jgi:hypothetical protein
MEAKDVLPLLLNTGLALFSVFTYYLGRKQEKTNNQKTRDKIIYAEIIKIIPDNIASYIKNTNFDGQHDRQCSDALLAFYHYCEKPEAFFLTKKVETAKKNLFTSANELHDILSSETYPADSKGFNEIPREYDWDKREMIAKAINQQSRNFYSDYENFVKTAIENLT